MIPPPSTVMRQLVHDCGPGTSVFGLAPHTRLAEVLDADVSAARQQWLDDAPDAAERLRPSRSDSLLTTNHDAAKCSTSTACDTRSMHGLRSQARIRKPSIMRHSVIVLTMNTYGHFCPVQAADEVARLHRTLETAESEPDARIACVSAHGAAGHDSMRAHAMAPHRCRSSAPSQLIAELSVERPRPR
ncbi:MAG: hypothetical protein KDA25_10560 [Phycisphaerales bacterium]|nr:hypothetical protein [Phycisphaerales bacterium]